MALSFPNQSRSLDATRCADTVGAATGAGVPDMGGAEDAPLEQKPRLPRLLIEAERIVMTRLA